MLSSGGEDRWAGGQLGSRHAAINAGTHDLGDIVKWCIWDFWWIPIELIGLCGGKIYASGCSPM